MLRSNPAPSQAHTQTGGTVYSGGRKHHRQGIQTSLRNCKKFHVRNHLKWLDRPEWMYKAYPEVAWWKHAPASQQPNKTSKWAQRFVFRILLSRDLKIPLSQWWEELGPRGEFI